MVFVVACKAWVNIIAPADLFFTMAAEGSSNNKFIEIHNPTCYDIDLADYGYPTCSNGCSSGTTYE